MEIYQLLRKDHREVEKLFQEITGTGQAANKAEPFQKLAEELHVHMEAEEKAFYKPLEKKPEAKELIAEGYKEHKEAEGILKQIKGTAGSPEWMAKVKELQQAIDHHVQEEEGEMFKTARKVLTEKQAEDIGEEFEKEKERMQKQGGARKAA